MDVPLGSVELEESNELERLRRRAYGPDADIAGDAAAQARLSELEAARRGQLTPVLDAATWVPARAPERVPVPEPVEGSRSASISVSQPDVGAFTEHQPAGGSVAEKNPAEGPIAESDPIDGASAAPWWRRRRRLAILGGAIAVLVLIAALVVWMSQLLAQGSTSIPTGASTVKIPPVPGAQGRPGGLLTPDYELALESVGADADKPNDLHGTLNGLGLSTDELRRYEDFRGMNVWSGESRYGTACLLVAVPGQGLREGFGAEGCSPEGLDTIAELLDGPTGSLLIRFVLEGDHVNVFIYERAIDPSAPQGYWTPRH